MAEQLTTAKDAFTAEAAPNQNFSTLVFLKLDGGAGTDNKKAYIWFPRPVAVNGQVIDATLKLYLQEAWAGGPHTITAKRITEAWSVNRVTWNNAPTVTATNQQTAAITGGTAGQEVTFDITAMVDDVAAGGAWQGIELSLDTTTTRALYSSEAPQQYRPVIVLSTSVLPDPPSNLSPDGARITSLTDPTFKWEFGSQNDEESQTEFKVNVDNDSAFGSLHYDSGWTASELQKLDATTVVFTALTNNTTYYWRVACRDENGLESDWSDTAEFTYRTLGTLTITEPTADNDDVEDDTPVITHTFSGRTQTATKYVIAKLVDADYVDVYTRDYVATTDLDFTPPAGVITESGAKYKVTLYVRDEYQRPENEVQNASRIFDYVAGSTVTAPAALTATATTGLPFVRLAWTRVAIPDFFVLERDGVEVEVFTGLSADAGSNNFVHDYYGAQPFVEHDYTVRAKTSAVGTSQSPTAASATLRPSGVWLAHADGWYFRVLGENEVSSTMAEDGDTLKLLNRRDPVRVVSRLGGLEGQVSGPVTSTYLESSYDVDDYRDALYTIIRDYGLTGDLRLIFGHRNIPVIVGNFSVAEWPNANEPVYDVSFDYWQVDEWEVAD